MAADDVVAPLPPERCEAPTPSAIIGNGQDLLQLQEASFADLPGWAQDGQGQALAAFRASCAKLAELPDEQAIGSGPYAGLAADWREACAAAQTSSTSDHAQARRFFEEEFKVYAAIGLAGPVGKFTGYYVQPLRASRKRGGPYQFPIYRRPKDLISVALSDFVEDGRGRRVWGRLADDGHRLVPHRTRAEYRAQPDIEQEVLLWLDSPSDVLLLEIEGSGKAQLDDGSTLMVAFAGKNGISSDGQARPTLRAVQALERKHRRGPWRADELALYETLVDQKSSMVFFELESRAGAIGTQDVILTDARSVAVDRAVIALSTPLWVDTRAPKVAGGPVQDFRHLMVAQDTGGAIIGSVRADIYFGDDAKAIDIGRRVRSSGRLWLLLPKEMQVPLATASDPAGQSSGEGATSQSAPAR